MVLKRYIEMLRIRLLCLSYRFNYLLKNSTRDIYLQILQKKKDWDIHSF